MSPTAWDWFARMTWCINASVALCLIGAPLWLCWFAAFCVSLFWPKLESSR